jgi:hypothetical protein
LKNKVKRLKKRPFRRPGHKWKNNTRTDLEGIGNEDVVFN